MIKFTLQLLGATILSFASVHMASGADLSGFLGQDSRPYCGIDGFETASESSCMWDATARASGSCEAPQYQVVVGKKSIFKSCSSVGVIAFWWPLNTTPPPEAPPLYKQIWRLMRALQPVAFDAVNVPPPSCVSTLKQPFGQNSKQAFVDFYECFGGWDVAKVERWKSSSSGTILRAVQIALERADVFNPQTTAAMGELQLFIEDNGSGASLTQVEDILKQFK